MQIRRTYAMSVSRFPKLYFKIYGFGSMTLLYTGLYKRPRYCTFSGQ